MLNKNKITVIIPVLNEAAMIERTLDRLGEVEIIVVDGGSEDETVNLVRQKKIEVIISPYRNRAYQMNLGAQKARGEILFFLHGDTLVPSDYAQIIAALLSREEAIAGEEKLLTWVARVVNWRSRVFSLPYGDQGIFIKTEVFRELGGYANLAIMEDFELVQRLRKKGKIAIAPVAVITSARRWQRLGIVRTTLLNQLIILGYYLGVPASTLARWYGRKPPKVL
jgi:rSAM/selenodomain-associated transferase 2